MPAVPFEIASAISLALVTAMGVLWKALLKSQASEKKSLIELISIEHSRATQIEGLTQALLAHQELISKIEIDMSVGFGKLRKDHRWFAKKINEFSKTDDTIENHRA